MKDLRRPALLGLALSATLVAAYYAPASSDAVAEPTAHAVAATQAKVEPQAQSFGLPIDRDETAPVLRPRLDNENQGLLSAFASPPAPVVAAPAPVPVASVVAAPVAVAPPQPPPIPFQVVGKFVDGSDQRVFLVFNGKNLVVHPGDTIGADYTVSAIDPDQLTVRYLPLDVTQTLPLPPPQ